MPRSLWLQTPSVESMGIVDAVAATLTRTPNGEPEGYPHAECGALRCYRLHHTRIDELIRFRAIDETRTRTVSLEDSNAAVTPRSHRILGLVTTVELATY